VTNYQEKEQQKKERGPERSEEGGTSLCLKKTFGKRVYKSHPNEEGTKFKELRACRENWKGANCVSRRNRGAYKGKGQWGERGSTDGKWGGGLRAGPKSNVVSSKRVGRIWERQGDH